MKILKDWNKNIQVQNDTKKKNVLGKTDILYIRLSSISVCWIPVSEDVQVLKRMCRVLGGCWGEDGDGRSGKVESE